MNWMFGYEPGIKPRPSKKNDTSNGVQSHGVILYESGISIVLDNL